MTNREYFKYIPIDNDGSILCDYGCGELAKYKTSVNDHYCCSDHCNKCPENIKKLTGENRPQYSLIENNGSVLCDYGCGELAKYKFVNGKYCCSDNVKRCQNERDKLIGIPQLFYTEFENSENKLCDYGCGQIAKFTSKFGKLCCGDYFAKCPNVKCNILDFKKCKERCPELVLIENLKEGPNGEILGHCKNSNCPNSAEKGGSFILTANQINLRNMGINLISDTNYFYCCEECKKECILFGKSATQLNAIVNQSEIIYHTSQEYSIWRNEVFTRQKIESIRDENFCEICGKIDKLQAHHEIPIKINPNFALDPDNGIVLCLECHHKFGHKKGTECSIGNLAKLICQN